MEQQRQGKHILFTFVRHGETDSNAGKIIQGSLNTSLNSVGREQAAALGKRFGSEANGFHFIFSSSNARAAETAEIVVGHLPREGQPSLVKSELLMERMLGVFEGQHFQEARKLLDWDSIPEPRNLNCWDKIAEGDESLKVENRHDYTDRIRRAIGLMLSQVMASEHPFNTSDKAARVLCVSHGLTIRGMLSELAHQAAKHHNPDERHRWFSCDVGNCSVTQVRCEIEEKQHGQPAVKNATFVVLNDVSHTGPRAPKHHTHDKLAC